MAILNNIRKRSMFLILIIALALFSFVLADLFRNPGALTSKSQNVVATINGKDITRTDFMRKVETMQRQMGANATTTQVMNRVWDQEVRKAVYQQQYDALGLVIEKDQIRDILKTNLANNPDFQNEAGMFDENKLNEYIANLKETSDLAYQQWLDYENNIGINALNTEYNNLVKASIVGTLAEGELKYKTDAKKVDVKFVQIPFSTIADSTIVVSNAEIKTYMQNHKKQYEVEASRDIQYVEFKEEASKEDENAIKAELQKLIKGSVTYDSSIKDTITVAPFSKIEDNATFVNTNSDVKFTDAYVSKSGLPATVADSIFNLSIHQVFGPYKDANFYKVSKLVAVKQLPDSVKARHILIPFVGSGSATAETKQTKEQAKATADSIYTIVKRAPSKFKELLSFSADKASNAKEGVLDWYGYNSMVPSFRDFTFENKTGTFGVVESRFGFHVIEILGQKNKVKMVKVATIAREIEPSEATISKVFRDAANFTNQVNENDFATVAKEANYTARPVKSIKKLDENIPGLNSQREIVRWAFKEDTKVGAIKKFSTTNGFAVVQLTGKNKEGMMNVQDASVTALPEIRKEKKAALIKQRISATTLEEIASAENQSVRTALALTMSTPTLTGAGNEPKVVGTAFGLEEGATSKLITGENGVYIIQVTKITPALALENYQTFANQVKIQQQNTVSSSLYNALKDASEIEDNRAETVQ